MKNSLRRYIVSISLAGILTISLGSTSCERRPKDVLSEKETVSLMADLQLAEAYVRLNLSGTVNEADRQAIANGVLREHGVTRKQYDATMAYYGNNFDKYVKLYAKVEKELRGREKSYLKEGSSSIEISESDLWPYGKNAFLSLLGSRDGIVFSITPDKLEKGETLEWMFRMNKQEPMKAVLGVDYDNGSSDYIIQTSQTDLKILLKLPTDSSLNVKRIFGTVRVLSSGNMPLWLDSISLIHRTFSEYDLTSSGTQRHYLPPNGKHKPKAQTDSMLNTNRRTTLTTDPGQAQKDAAPISTVATGDI